MARHWGLGPVFARELVAGARRWQFYAMRAGFGACLMVWLGMIWSAHAGTMASASNEMAAVGREFFSGLVVNQLTLVLLAAPAATAGAICVDKGRGTLLHVFVTDLTDGEIVRGKLAARLAPVLGLVACGLPVLALCALFGGLAAEVVLGAYLVTFGAAVVACALALTLSAWARKTHQALLGTYALVGAWVGVFFLLIMVFRVGGPGFPPWHPLSMALYINPYGMALIPIHGGSPFWPVDLTHQAAFCGVACLLAAGLNLVARRVLRPAALAQASRPAKREAPGAPARIVRRLPAPPLDGNPVLWREWHRKLPSRWTGRFWAAYTAISALASLVVIGCYYSMPGGWTFYAGGWWYHWHPGDWAAQVNAWGVAIGLLLLSVSAATALAEERDRGSLDVVMATPLPTSAIVWGKWWGTFALVPRLLILPTWVAFGMAMVSGRGLAALLMVGLILAYAAAITSLGLALATWMPRMSRVVTACVIAYVLASVGWPVLLEGLISYSHVYQDPRLEMRIASPYFGVATMTGLAGQLFFSGYNSNEVSDSPSTYTWAALWILAYGSIAAVLALAARATFDRCLGRVAEGARRGGPEPRPPRRKTTPEPVEAR